MDKLSNIDEEKAKIRQRETKFSTMTGLAKVYYDTART